LIHKRDPALFLAREAGAGLWKNSSWHGSNDNIKKRKGQERGRHRAGPF
jgi:hypothetical protein